MLHLVLKEFYVQRKIAYFVPLFLLPYFLTLGKEIPNQSYWMQVFFYSMSIGFIAYLITTYSNFNTNEGEKNQNRLLLSLPVNRQTVINAKYIMISAWWLIAYIAYVAIKILLNILFDFQLTTLIDYRVLVGSLCFTYLLVSLFYPLHFKFGFRVASLIGVGAFFLITSSLGKLLPTNKNSTVVSIIMEHPIVSFAIITLVIVLISYSLSLRIFTKRDF